MKSTLRSVNIGVVGIAFLFTALSVLLIVDVEFTGKATTATTVNVTNSTPVTCVTAAYVGMNTVSFACISSAQAIDGVINGSGITATYQYVPGDADLWRVNNPNLPSWVVQDLRFLSRKTGYVLVLTENKTISFDGLEAATTTVPLLEGWNLVGYPTTTTLNASDSLTTINNFTQARTYDALSSTYLVYLNPGGGTLTLTRQGEGYWINATQATNWEVAG